MKLSDNSLIIKPTSGLVVTRPKLIQVNDRRRIKPAVGDLSTLDGKTLSLPCIHELHQNCQLGDNCYCCCHAIARAERHRVAEQMVDRFLHRYD